MSKMQMPAFGAAALVALLSSCGSGTLQTADYAVIPQPVDVTSGTGDGFKLDSHTVIVAPADNDSLKGYADLLAGYIEQMTGNRLEVVDEAPATGAIVLARGLDNSNPEAYTLTVNPDRIDITGSTAAGAFYGVQTLRKSIPAQERGDVLFPPVTITDYPRFGYRGAMLDVSRHFFPADSVKAFIDMLAMHNINRLHWHLTDDQGWRLEVKDYPLLTQISSTRPGSVIGHNSGEYDSVPVEGFYTNDQIRDIVKYASDRNITIVPEIDLPGHMVAALAAYPSLGCTGGPYEVWQKWGVSEDLLCAGNDSTLIFLDSVLDAVTDLFPGELVHIGGDECPKVRWEECAKCQARIRELGLKDDKHSTAEQKLQSYVMEHAQKYLAERGRRVIGWDEILEGGMSDDAVVMSWRGENGGIEGARRGHDVIMTPNSYLYFDYYQTLDRDNEPIAIGGYVPVEKVYSYEPMPEALTPEEQQRIKGVQANLWTEYIPTFSQVQYMELPRMAALSEVQWSPKGTKDYIGFTKRVPRMVNHYEANGWNYAKHIFNVNPVIEQDSVKNAFVVTLTTVDDADVRYTLDGTEPTAESALYEGPLSLDKTAVVKAAAFRPSGRSSVWSDSVSFNKATAHPAQFLQAPSKQYEAKGASTLVDGRFGGPAFNTGDWVGFVGNDVEAVVDLQQPTQVSSVTFNTLVQTGDWIFDATGASVAVSLDGTTWQEVASQTYTVPDKDLNKIQAHTLEFPATEARYVKLTAPTLKQLPAWHVGKGKPAFVFVDEIVIN